MKTKLIYLISLLPFLSYSQTTVQQSSLPVIGDAWVSHSNNAATPASFITSPGPGQTWNFSSLDWMAAFTDVAVFINPATLNGSSFFPNSNIASQDVFGNNTFNSFFRSDPSGVMQVGSYTYGPSSGTGTSHNINDYALHVPFTFGNITTDTSIEETITIYSTIPVQPAERQVYIRIKNQSCDAWGTLLTPCHANPVDVVRMREQYMGFIDSMFVDSSGTGAGPWTETFTILDLNPSQFIDWNFFQNDKPCIVFSIGSDSTNAINDENYYCDTLLNSVNDNFQLKNISTIYPNPVNGEFVHIRIPVNEVRRVVVYNLSGTVIKELPVSRISTINLSSDFFRNGIYFCSFFDENNRRIYNEKFVVNR